MVRISKQGERRSRSHRKHRAPSPQSGPKKDNLQKGFKPHLNALEGEVANTIFIGKVS